MIRRGGVTDVPEVFGAVGNKVSHIYSILHRVVIMLSAISQLRVLASHRRKFGVCRSRRLEIRALGSGEVPFLNDPCTCLAISSKKKCL